MAVVRLCPNCSTQLPSDSPRSLCPACLMQQAMEVSGDQSKTRTGVNQPHVSGHSADMALMDLQPGTIIGRYTVVEKLGAGGFGTVYKASQKSPVRRSVAIKILKAGLDTREFIARFEGERQALARMDHPNVARMYDAGSTRNGRPFFVMEFLPGKPITTYADENQLTIVQRLELFRQVCAGVGHAHTKAMIHRDIKPSNVMAYTQDALPVVKVIDFGIAKAISGDQLPGQTVNTLQGQALGTFDAMSPEQAAGSSDIDTRTDVYAMGVLLYELLTGCKPFDWPKEGLGNPEELRRIIRDVEPARPSTRLTTGISSIGASSAGTIARYRKTTTDRLVRDLRQELEWIPIKAMRKNRAERYASTAELDADIVRFLEGRPLVAGPDSFTYTARKYLRRHRGALAIAALIVAAMAVAVTLYVAGIRRERQRADAARGVAEQQRAIAEQQRAIAEHQTALEAEAAGKIEASAVEAHAQTLIARRAAARSEARYLTQQNLLPAAFQRASDAWQLGGQWEDGVTCSEIASAASVRWRLIGSVPAGDTDFGCFVSSGGKTFLATVLGESISNFDVTTGALLGHITSDPQVVYLLADEKNESVVVCCRTSVTRLQLPDLRPVAHRELEDGIRFGCINAGRLLLIQPSGDSRILDSRDLSDVDLLKWADQPETKDVPVPTQGCINPSGTCVALHGGNWWKPSILWKRGGERPVVIEASLRVSKFAFADNNQLLCWFTPDSNGGYASDLTTYDVSNFSSANRAIMKTSSFEFPADDIKTSLEMQCLKSSDGSPVVVVAGSTGCGVVRVADAKTWSDRYSNLLPTDPSSPEFLCQSARLGLLALRRSSDTLIFRRAGDTNGRTTNDFCATVCRTGQLVLNHDYTPDHFTLDLVPFDARRPSKRWKLNWLPPAADVRLSFPWAVCATQTGSTVVMVSQDSPDSNVQGTVYGKVHAVIFRPGDLLTAPATWPISKVFDLPIPPSSNWTMRFATVDPGGSVLLNWNRSEQPHRFSLIDGSPLDPLPAMSTACRSDDGRYVAGHVTAANDVSIFDVASGRSILTLHEKKRCAGLCFSSDSNRISIADGHSIETYEVPSGRQLSSILSRLVPLAFSAVGYRFAALQTDSESGGGGGNLVLADTTGGNVAVVIGRAGTAFCPSSFSPDGQALALVMNRWRTDLIYAMPPSQLAEALQANRTTPDLIPAQSPAARSHEKMSDQPLSALQSLRPFLGEQVSVKGVVHSAKWTAAHNALNIEFEGPDETLNMCWVPPDALPRLAEKFGADLDVKLVGKQVLVTGVPSKYGGLSARWRRRMQIQIDDPDQLQIVDSQK